MVLPSAKSAPLVSGPRIPHFPSLPPALLQNHPRAFSRPRYPHRSGIYLPQIGYGARATLVQRCAWPSSLADAEKCRARCIPPGQSIIYYHWVNGIKAPASPSARFCTPSSHRPFTKACITLTYINTSITIGNDVAPQSLRNQDRR